MDWKAAQNSDGGWPYGRGSYSRSSSGQPSPSWTEPTVFALLAQSVSGAARDREGFSRGVSFLRAMRGSDGGFRPQSEVRESTWVTALAALLPEGVLDTRSYVGTINWLKGQTGRESGWTFRFQRWLDGNSTQFPKGWPWFPGAAAWVIPTALGIMAFERAESRGYTGETVQRITEGREFLLSHACADGGWNHGNNQSLGRDGDSYPETTGIALLALRGVAISKGPATNSLERIERGKAAARKHLGACRSAEGIAWLRMGLAAHGENVRSSTEPARRTVMDEALWILANAADNPLTTNLAPAKSISHNTGISREAV